MNQNGNEVEIFNLVFVYLLEFNFVCNRTYEYPPIRMFVSCIIVFANVVLERNVMFRR